MILIVLAAQAATPLARPPVFVPAPAPTAHAADPARLAAADALLGAMRIERSYDAMLGQLIPIISAQTFDNIASSTKVPAAVREKLADPALLARARAQFAGDAAREFRHRYPAMRAATAQEYAAAFTLDELKALAAFYDSPVGRKSIDLVPALQAKLAPIGARAGFEAGVAAMRSTVQALDLEPRKDDRS